MKPAPPVIRTRRVMSAPRVHEARRRDSLQHAEPCHWSVCWSHVRSIETRSEIDVRSAARVIGSRSTDRSDRVEQSRNVVEKTPDLSTYLPLAPDHSVQ